MRILLADDHGLFRDSMAVWLQRCPDRIGEGGEVEVEFAVDWDSLWARLPEGFDLLLVDLGMPGMDGAASVDRLRAAAPATPILVVSANGERAVIEACLDAGAAGYITKASPGEEILEAVATVLRGARYRPSLPEEARPLPMETLSERQRQVLARLARGESNRTIAERLALTEGTVKQYVSQLLDILDVDNRTQAGNLARQLLGIDPRE